MRPTDRLVTTWGWDAGKGRWAVESHEVGPVTRQPAPRKGRAVTVWTLGYGVWLAEFTPPGDDCFGEAADPRTAFGHGIELRHLLGGHTMREIVVAEVERRLAGGGS